MLRTFLALLGCQAAGEVRMLGVVAAETEPAPSVARRIRAICIELGRRFRMLAR
jgi:hypothetical protein